uniref:UMP-CMP kinase-like n=1 Tax=Styela clava TaxID=7725 RepID=UPI00193A18B3|nr:UMP-CMP kinase-like [Styela clava]
MAVMPVVFVLGRPGSGKGTQSAKLADEFNFVHLSAGELLRKELKAETAVSDILKTHFSKGLMAPSEITCNLLLSEMENEKKLFLIDGFPVDMDNLKMWETLSKGNVDLKSVLLLECAESVSKQRILARSETSNRSDDNLESLSRRFEYFTKHTNPVIDFYAKAGKLQIVDANNSVETVFMELCKIISEIQ